MPHPDMCPPPPEWMPGKEAIAHICKVDNCSKADAIEQLRKAIVLGVVRARLDDPRYPGRDLPVAPFAQALESLGMRAMRDHELQRLSINMPTSEMWSKAEISADGKVTFPGYIGSHAFEVLRDGILKWEAASPDGAQSTPGAPATAVSAPAIISSIPRWRTQPSGSPRQSAARAAIAALLPGIIGPELQSKERNNRIREWCKRNNLSEPSDRTIIRVLRDLK